MRRGGWLVWSTNSLDKEHTSLEMGINCCFRALGVQLFSPSPSASGCGLWGGGDWEAVLLPPRLCPPRRRGSEARTVVEQQCSESTVPAQTAVHAHVFLSWWQQHCKKISQKPCWSQDVLRLQHSHCLPSLWPCFFLKIEISMICFFFNFLIFFI